MREVDWQLINGCGTHAKTLSRLAWTQGQAHPINRNNSQLIVFRCPQNKHAFKLQVTAPMPIPNVYLWIFYHQNVTLKKTIVRSASTASTMLVSQPTVYFACFVSTYSSTVFPGGTFHTVVTFLQFLKKCSLQVLYCVSSCTHCSFSYFCLNVWKVGSSQESAHFVATQKQLIV